MRTRRARASVQRPRLVCGGRDYTDKDRLWATLDALLGERGVARVIAGGAKGADTMAEEWAKDRGALCNAYMANWAELGRKAGPIRNQQMLDEGRPHPCRRVPWRAWHRRHDPPGQECER